MDKQTLSNYGWIVICVLVLSVMIAFATPFGSFVSNAVQSTTEGLFDVENKAIGRAMVEVGLPNPALNHKNVIPKGATYTIYSTGEVLHAGDEFPSVTKNGDIYTCGYYVYEFYGYSNGWNVKTTDKTRTSYNAFLESINGYVINDMGNTFADCVNLTTDGVPEIPKTIRSLYHAFDNCKSLVSAPTIPSNITSTYMMFAGCDSLQGYVYVPCTCVYNIGYSTQWIEYYHYDGCGH